MIRNYFKIAWRSLCRKPLFPFVNIFGLSVGLSGFITLLFYLNYEKSYDTWHPDLSRVYKVGMEGSDGILWDGMTQAPLASFLRETYPGVQAATRVSGTGNDDFEMLADANNKKIYQKGVIEADSLFFTVFPYQFVYGDERTALQAPDAVVLEESLAGSYFGNTNPIGQPISLYGGRFKGTVTGVIKAPSTPSVLNARVVMRSPYEKQNNHWQNFSYETYIKLLRPATDHGLVAADINRLYRKDFLSGEKEGKSERPADFTYFTEKFTELHTDPKSGGSNLPVINILLFLAASLLIAGAVNFSNLAAADACRRAGEVGVRKVLGSGRIQLFGQFMIDVGIQVLLASALAIVFVAVIIPWFQSQFHVRLSFFQPGISTFYFQLIACLLLTVLIAGAYPAILLSGFNPVGVLKGDVVKAKNGLSFGNILTVFQLVLSGFFIICSLVIFRQVEFMQSKDKGFSEEQVLRIQTTQPTRDQHFDKTRQRLLSVPGVREVAKTTAVPGDAFMDTSSVSLRWNDTVLKMNEVKVSREYFSAINATLLQGRWFDGRYADEHTRSALINEAAAKQMGIADPVGEIVRFPYCDTVQVQIIGVIKDFNVRGLNVPVQPAIFDIGNFACGFRSGGAILVKIDAAQTQQTLAAIENTWKEIEPEFPIRYTFLSENFQKLYAEYLRIQQVVFYFTLVAIFIAVTGLLAMSVFLVRERTKELGIRKVLGAGTKDIFKLTSRKFLIQVLVATLIAVPLGWIAAEKWLQNFAYRFELKISVFLMSAAILIVVALLTVSFQVIKAARANPVKALRMD